MKGVSQVFGVGAACVLACALPMLLPMLGLAGFSLGLDTWAVLAFLGLGTAVGLIIRRRRSKMAACAIDGSCGYKGKAHE